MSEAQDEHIAGLEAALDRLQKESSSVQQVLGLVLNQLGEPVTITHQEVVEGLPDGTQIFIDEDPVTHDHTFGLVFPTVDNDA